SNFGSSFFVVWLLYGYSFGLLGGMLARKTFLALAFAAPAAVTALLPWIPTFFAGGMTVWQLYVVPVMVLILARLSVWPWAPDRMLGGPNIARWGTTFALCSIWIIACLGYRVWQVAPADEPFNVAEFRASYKTLEKSEAPSLIRLAVTQHDQHIRK